MHTRWRARAKSPSVLGATPSPTTDRVRTPRLPREAGSLRTDSIDGLQVGIVAALVSAGIHLFRGVQFVPSGLGIGFLLPGLGFGGAVVLVLVDYRRRAVYGVGVPYTLAGIVLWYVINFANGPKSFPGEIGALGAVDKVAQVVLIAVVVRYRRES